MRNIKFKSVYDVLGSDTPIRRTRATDRIFKSTRLEDKVYSELRAGDTDMDAIETLCTPKLSAFSALARDVYQSFYSLQVRRNDENDLSDTAKRFNSPILDKLMNGGDYPAIKSACEGRRVPAYDAASEFISSLAGELDTLLKEAGGDKGALSTLEKLSKQEDELIRSLEELLKTREKHGASPELDRQITNKANDAAGKSRQVEAVGGQIRDNLVKNKDSVGVIIAKAVSSALDTAEETARAVTVWGQGGNDSSPEQIKLDRGIAERVRGSSILKDVTRFLGRFKEMAAAARKNGFAYGRGQTYSLETGDDLQNVLTSEFSMLAIPCAVPLFLRKYQDKGLQQYRRREPVFKGSGDIVMCLDESDSARDDAPWGKAMALALLDAAMSGGRKFALIHFSGEAKFKTDIFLPGKYGIDDVFAAAETFLGGGTDFQTPMNEAYRLISKEGFENADIIFVTDGECGLQQSFLQEFKLRQQAHGFSITGVLLDMSSPGMVFSLESFCDKILRTSELSKEEIVVSLISKRV